MEIIFAHPRDWGIPINAEYNWMFGAIVYPHDETKYSRIFINPTKPKWRQAITLIHEVGHHVINTIVPKRCRNEAHLCLDIAGVMVMWWECDVTSSIDGYIDVYKSRKVK